MFPYYIDNAIMIAVGLILCTIAIVKQYEPLLLLPIGFGAIIVNIPGSGLMDPGGFLRIIYDAGITTEIFPILIFIAIGAMCDFGSILERPWLMIFSAAGQIGIFVALLSALAIGFAPLEASSIGIIGAMDGPTAIYVTSQFAPQMLGAITVCAYSYMSMVPIFQVPISKALTTRKERITRMQYKPAKYPKIVRLVFPIIVTLVTCLIAPKATPLMGSLMFGNFLRESGVVERLVKSAENELTNLVTLLLGITIGGTMLADQFLKIETLLILALGVVAFASAIGCGILIAKLAYYISRGKVNPLIGACGVSAYPMAGRTAHIIGRKEDPNNWLLPQAIATNTGGQIASVVAGGAVLTFAPLLLGGLFS